MKILMIIQINFREEEIHTEIELLDIELDFIEITLKYWI